MLSDPGRWLLRPLSRRVLIAGVLVSAVRRRLRSMKRWRWLADVLRRPWPIILYCEPVSGVTVDQKCRTACAFTNDRALNNSQSWRARSSVKRSL